MPHVFEVDDLQQGYINIALAVMAEGKEVAPRGQATREVLDAVIQLNDPRKALPVGINRKLNPAIAAAEAIQLIGAYTEPRMMTSISTNFARFMDDDRFWAPYGARIGTQMIEVERKLREDPGTRQAVVTLWDPTRDNVEGKHDYPCTVMLQFFIRNGELMMHTTMRSNDVYWGLTYDAFQFTQLQLTLANVLGLPAGPYLHHAVSLHIYERDFDAIGELRAPKTWRGDPLPNGFDGDTMEDVIRDARVIGLRADTPLDTSERWYDKLLTEHR